jgi:cytochrome c biogenesis protein CcmG/thiol:disulfide interchange protein DsbE
MKTQPLQKLIAPIIAIVASLALFMGPLEAQVDSLAPPFEIADSNGTPLHFPDDLEGPTIVLFWASWCPYCKALMPHLQSIVDEYEGEIQVLALNFRDDEDPAEFVAEYGYDFRVFPLADPVASLWGVKATPGLFLVNESGLIVFSNYSIPESAYPTESADEGKTLKRYQKAARIAPFLAAQLRLAIDKSRAPAN